METFAPIAFMLIVSFIVIFVSRKKQTSNTPIKTGKQASFVFGGLRIVGTVVNYYNGEYELYCDEFCGVRMSKVFVKQNLVTPL